MHREACENSRSAGRPTHRIRAVFVAVSTFAAAACAGSGAGSEGTASTAPDTSADTLSAEIFIPAPDDSTGEATGGTAAGGLDTTPPGQSPIPETAPLDVATTTIPVVPETGVPGLDSSDEFCRAWSEFAGTFQALGLASAVGDATAAIRLEVIASSAVIAAVGRMDLNLPPGLEQERRLLVDDFAGPFARRAAKAQLELDAAGVTALEDLQDAWLQQLAEIGVDDPGMVIVLPASVDDAAIDSAADSFGSLVPGIVEDPSLITDVAIPLTDQYLAGNCPDQGILGGNDRIDS